MMSIEETIYLLTSGLVSEMYLPHSYLTIPDIDHILRNDNWMIIPSAIDGWMIVRRRVVYQD